jgi:hypothetical protein
VQVDGAGVRLPEDARLLHGAQDGAGALFDDDELVRGGGAQADRGGWRVRLRPRQAGRPARKPAGLGELVGARHALFAEVHAVRRSERDLIGGRL